VMRAAFDCSSFCACATVPRLPQPQISRSKPQRWRLGTRAQKDIAALTHRNRNQRADEGLLKSGNIRGRAATPLGGKATSPRHLWADRTMDCSGERAKAMPPRPLQSSGNIGVANTLLSIFAVASVDFDRSCECGPRFSLQPIRIFGRQKPQDYEQPPCWRHSRHVAFRG
jgi:hypothetical protein